MRSTSTRALLVVTALASLALGSAAAGCTEDELVAPTDPPDASSTPVDATTDAPSAAPDAGSGRDCARDLASDGLPNHLDCTGLYASFASKTPADGVKPYAPGAQLWSDDAVKTRFVYLPPGTTIDATNLDDWKLPVGTKLWKEFALDGKRIETRLYAKVAEGSWKHTTYRWKADESDAERLDTGEMVPRADGGPDYEVPRSDQCNVCHKGRTEPTLGFEAVSLALPGASGATLAALVDAKLLAPAPPATATPIPDDGTAKAAKALGWLHANCGSCHSSSTKAEAYYTGTFFQIRAGQLQPVDGGVKNGGQLDAVKTTCGLGSSKSNPDGGAPLFRLQPGSPQTSAIYVLPASRAPQGAQPNPNQQMPPIVSHRVDPDGIAALKDWISALAACPPK